MPLAWTRVLLAALLSAAVAPVPAARAQQEDPVAANRALAAAFEQAWNAHTMDAPFRKLLTDDVDWVNVDGGRGHGIEKVVSGHVRVHAGKFKDSVMTIREVDVALVRPDVAVVHVNWGLRGDTDNDGTPRPPREGLFTWVTVREDDGWKIRASHNSNKTPVR